MCCNSGSFGGPDGEEQKAVKKWFDDVKGDWEDDFKNKDFELWDEFDLRKSDDLRGRLEGFDPDRAGCQESWQDLRWDLGYKVYNPNLYDWDDKIAKKGIVAAMQPKDEEEPWYLPLLFAAYSPSFTKPDQIGNLERALRKYFDTNPDGLVFVKLAVSGSSGTGIPDCFDGQTWRSNMYKFKADFSREALLHCVAILQEISEQSNSDRNPALKYGFPGLLAEPGFEHQTELKALVLWGKLFIVGAEKPNCCVFYSNDYRIFRGFDGDDRKAVDGRDPRSYSQWTTDGDALLSKSQFAKVREIAEGIGKHADYIRVDIFVNTKSGKAVVNEIESFFRCGAMALKTDDLAVEYMKKLWLEGWKAYGSRTNALTSVLRPFSQEQMAVATSGNWSGSLNPDRIRGDPGRRPAAIRWRVPPIYGVLIYFAWPVSTVACFAAGFLVRRRLVPQSLGARNVEQVELTTHSVSGGGA